MKMTVATCQFAVGSDIARTCGKIISLLEKAVRGVAHIAHFGECSLGGTRESTSQTSVIMTGTWTAAARRIFLKRAGI